MTSLPQNDRAVEQKCVGPPGDCARKLSQRLEIQGDSGTLWIDSAPCPARSSGALFRLSIGESIANPSRFPIEDKDLKGGKTVKNRTRVLSVVVTMLLSAGAMAHTPGLP